MPRPKRPGAPEPKKRSRTGCWPCKARKVKCDELRPTCLNCQRTGETCDYSVRLNWEGRGKKVEGVINFSSNSISISPGPSSIPAIASAPPQMVFQAAVLPMQPAGLILDTRDVSRASTANSNPFQGHHISPRRAPPSDMAIDPALTGFQVPAAPMYAESMYGAYHGRTEYTQSYERYREDGPSTPILATLPSVSRLRETQGSEDGLSPDSGIQSPSASTFSNRSNTLAAIDSPTSTPPYYPGRDDSDMVEGSGCGRPAKRMRSGYHTGPDISTSFHVSMAPPNSATFSYHMEQQQALLRPGLGNSAGTPPTPGSFHSDEIYKTYPLVSSPYVAQESPDLRRLSVNSLLSGPPGMPHHTSRANAPRSIPEEQEQEDIAQNAFDYGIDRGTKDLDIPNNDDMNAITGTSPVSKRAHLELVLRGDEWKFLEFGFGDNISAFEKGGYYYRPVTISIPRVLEPLPSKLLENPMNLLYFHHFINHTAGCLIPHNCSSNPFRRILPQMAVQDDNLLNLLLAYSASHRARLLRQPEPATRIAMWVRDIFPSLRKALDDPNQIISNAILATAIMLASLEIISPKAFGVEVPWQRHLDTARQMILARGGPKGMRVESRSDMVSDFLWSWFAYLDVLGSLSGGKNSPSSSWVLDYHVEGDTDYEIDCVLGFTSKCIRILAMIAELARVCDSERIRPEAENIEEWLPSEKTLARAQQLEAELAESRLHPPTPCPHMQSTGEAAYQWDSLEMDATNEAYHWAGHVHLHRRILGKPSSHPDVQNGVREIFGALYKVRRGSNAEGCLLFPMFTAGCDTQDEKQREDILERIKGVERLGMTQVHKARALMERVWETGKPWETLVAGEFFG